MMTFNVDGDWIVGDKVLGDVMKLSERATSPSRSRIKVVLRDESTDELIDIMYVPRDSAQVTHYVSRSA